MKMKKILGTAALTAALALGTTPAFAASVADDGSTNAFSDSGSTEVKAKVDTVNKQVRAQVPLSVTVVFAGHGASDIMGPSASSYKITNIGEGDIKITDAEISGVNELFDCSPIRLTDIEDESVEGDKMMFYYITKNNKTYLTSNHKLSQATTGTTQTRYIAGAKGFTAEELAPGESLGIELGGKAYFNSTFTQDDLTDTLCTIKYTIAAATE